MRLDLFTRLFHNIQIQPLSSLRWSAADTVQDMLAGFSNATSLPHGFTPFFFIIHVRFLICTLKTRVLAVVLLRAFYRKWSQYFKNLYLTTTAVSHFMIILLVIILQETILYLVRWDCIHFHWAKSTADFLFYCISQSISHLRIFLSNSYRLTEILMGRIFRNYYYVVTSRTQRRQPAVTSGKVRRGLGEPLLALLARRCWRLDDSRVN